MHKDERIRKITVNNGKTEYERREKFCAEHGWIDVFAVGGDVAWHRIHANCGHKPQNGEAVQINAVGKLMAKAA